MTIKLTAFTHLYKGQQVQFLNDSYLIRGKQYCTIVLINKFGKAQHQTVLKQNLKPLSKGQVLRVK